MACEKVYETKEDEEEDEQNDTDNEKDEDNVKLNEDSNDYIWDTTNVVQITLNTNSITVVPSVATVSGSKVTITSPGTYNIKGTLTDGQIIVDVKADTNVYLIMDGVNIKCLKSAPLFISKARKVVIILKKGTENVLTDGTVYVTDDNGEPNAALFGNSYITITGEGSLNVTSNYKDGISTDDGLVIKSGTISVSAVDDGLRGKDYLIIHDGNITINSKGDGLKSDNAVDNTLGYITIDKGTINIIASAGDAINSQTNLTINGGTFNITTGGGAPRTSVTTEIGNLTGPPFPPGGGTGGSSGYSGTISEKALKGAASLMIMKGIFNINSADDAIHSNNVITINDGTFTIATGDDAVHGGGSITINGGSINISKCYEGMEGPSITVNDGIIILASTDDSFNATMGAATEANDGSCVYIKGGTIVLNPSTGDGMDSNGNVVMSGGTVIVHGPQSAPEVGFDVNGTFSISGGFLFGTGPNSGNMIETPSTTSAQYFIKVTISSTLSTSSLLHIESANGTNLVTYQPVRSIYYAVFSSPDLKNGSSYSIYTGGTSTGTYSNGIYTGGTYSGGTLKKTFTISSKLTSISF